MNINKIEMKIIMVLAILTLILTLHLNRKKIAAWCIYQNMKPEYNGDAREILGSASYAASVGSLIKIGPVAIPTLKRCMNEREATAIYYCAVGLNEVGFNDNSFYEKFIDAKHEDNLSIRILISMARHDDTNSKHLLEGVFDNVIKNPNSISIDNDVLYDLMIYELKSGNIESVNKLLLDGTANKYNKITAVARTMILLNDKLINDSTLINNLKYEKSPDRTAEILNDYYSKNGRLLLGNIHYLQWTNKDEIHRYLMAWARCKIL